MQEKTFTWANHEDVSSTLILFVIKLPYSAVIQWKGELSYTAAKRYTLVQHNGWCPFQLVCAHNDYVEYWPRVKTNLPWNATTMYSKIVFVQFNKP